MKNNILLLSIFYFLLTSIFVSCNDDDKRSSIVLDKSSITIKTKGGRETVKLTTNGKWEIKDIPEWISVNPSFGEYSAEVIVEASKNEEIAERNATLTFAQGNTSKTLEVKQLGLMDSDPFIKLSTNDLSMSLTGDEKKITLTTNRSWKATNIPNWVVISPTSGDESTEITIKVNENRNPETRQVNIIFVNEDVSQLLEISQFGLKEVIRGPTLPIFSFKYVEFASNYTKYSIKVNSLFVNPEIKNKIYSGNLISHDTQLNTDIFEFTGYTFNPVTVSTSAAIDGEIVKTYIPSLTEQDTFARQIIAKNPSQNESFTADNGSTEFYSYRRLHVLGITNIGIKLDEVVSGSSFTKKEMTRKYGIIFSFKQLLFSLTTDKPEALIKETLTEADKAKGVSYVSVVNYGKVGLLVVESDTDSRNVKFAINKVIANQPLTQEESNLIQSADISYVYFNNNKEVQVKKGNIDAVNAYKDAMTNKKDNIYPVTFQLANYDTHAVSTLPFSFSVPE